MSHSKNFMIFVLIAMISACTSFKYPVNHHELEENLHSHDPDQVALFYQDEILNSVNQFMQSLSMEQRKRVLLEFKNSYRTRGFCYVLAHCKTDYVGLRMRDLNARQKIALNSFLMKSLSKGGYVQAIETLNREWLLQEMELAHRDHPERYPVVGSPKVHNWQPPISRGGEDFYIAFFGTPSADSQWAVRFEGHHLSINLTFGPNGELGIAPIFFGSSPMTVPEAPKEGRNDKYKNWAIQEGQQSMRREAWLARNFLKQLSSDQLGHGRWESLPHAVLEGGTSAIPIKSQPIGRHGIRVDSLTDFQKNLLIDYLISFSSLTQSSVFSRVYWEHQLEKTLVWWYGDMLNEESELYFRVQTPRYLVELLQSNTFGVASDVAANHIHAGFRDLENDWDYDVINDHVTHHH